MRGQLAVQTVDRKLAPSGVLRERFGNPLVKFRASRMRVRLVERLANEWMREHQLLFAAHDKTCTFGFIEQTHHLFRRTPRYQRQQLGVQLVINHRANREQRVRSLRKSCKPTANYLTHAGWYGKAGTFALEQTQVCNFLHEEGIAVGPALYLAHEGSRSNTPQTLNKRVSAVRIQAPKWDPLDGRRQVAKQVRCSRAQLQGIVPSGKHEHRG